jgi:hypothetical protein
VCIRISDYGVQASSAGGRMSRRGARLHEHQRRRLVLVGSCSSQWCPAVVVLAVHVGARRQQRAHGLRVPLQRGDVQRRRRSVDIGACRRRRMELFSQTELVKHHRGDTPSWGLYRIGK